MGGGIFETFFGGGAQVDREGRQRGSDLRYDMQITLEEAAFGVEKEIEVRKLDTCTQVRRQRRRVRFAHGQLPYLQGRGQVISSRGFFQVSQTCPRCRGVGQIIEKPCRVCEGEGRVEKASRIKIKIPAGIAEGSRLRSSRNGEAGIRGGAHGDLYVVIHVKEHEIFQRDEDNLYCELPIPFTLAALGGEVAVPTLEGKANLKIPAGTQSGQIFKLRDKGIMNVNGRDRGDLLARVVVEVPTRLNGEQRQKLEEFAALCGEENTPAAQELLRPREGLLSVGRTRPRRPQVRRSGDGRKRRTSNAER